LESKYIQVGISLPCPERRRVLRDMRPIIERKVATGIDHIDGDTSNRSEDNLCLLCKKHNCQMRGKKPSEHKSIIESYSLQNESEKEIGLASPATHFVKEVVDYHSGSEEMKVNSISEPRFLDWVSREVTPDEEVPKKDLIAAGAYYAGCSIETAQRYLDKLTCSIGPYYEATDAFGRKVIRRKTTRRFTSRSSSSHAGKARSQETAVGDQDTAKGTS